MVITSKLEYRVKADGTANIYIYIYDARTREKVKIPTEYFVKPGDWTGTEVDRKNASANYLNAKLTSIKSDINNHWLLNQDLTPHELKKWREGPIDAIKYTPVTYYAHYLQLAREGKILNKRTKEPLAANTIKAMNSSSHYLEKFSKVKKCSWDGINSEWFDEWVSFKRNTLKLNQNTIAKSIKHFKIIKAHCKGKHHNNEFKDYSIQTVKAQKIRLTPAEVEAIINLDLVAKDAQDLIPEQERFQVAYNLMLRFGDTISISEKNIVTKDKRHYLSAFAQKTRNEILLPIKKDVYKILKKNNFSIKAVNSTSNDNLKRLGMLAKINSNVTITEFKNGAKIETVKKKYELMETHTTRRSAARNLYDAKLDPFIIQVLGGWKSQKQMLEYIDIDLDYAANKAVDHPFFN